MEYVTEMKKYIDIDIFGKCGDHDLTESIGFGQNFTGLTAALKTTYKFYLSFENSICHDYITEKFFNPFQFRAHYIPVVRGGVDYDKYFPQDVFINTKHFQSPKDLALHLKQLGSDPEKYAAMLKAQDRLTTWNYKFDWCDVCDLAHSPKTKVIPDLGAHTKDNQCWPPDDL